MENSTIAQTRAEAESQQFTIPTDYEKWVEFAHLIDGYKIAEEMGFDLMQWSGERQEEYHATNQWKATILELRLLLFAEARAARFSWGEPFEEVDSLLNELARQTGQDYKTDPAVRARYENQTPEDMGLVITKKETPQRRKKRSKE